MKSLVLCVDRDDDLGRKAGLKGPIIGRESNLRAAVLLGTKDPGDTDTNSIFAAINLYDRMKAEGMDVEIATITGDVNVGIVSDQNLRNQMIKIVEKINPKDVYFVSDGAEDEFILPIIYSIVNVVHVERVVIKKQKTIEETYYAMVKILEDEKIQKKFMVPLGVLIIALSIITLTGYPQIGVAFVGLLFGAYLLIKSYKLEAPLQVLYSDLKEALETGRYITSLSIAIAILVSLYGIINAISQGIEHEMILTAINFLFLSLWYVIAGIFIYMVGSSIDTYFKERRFLWGVISRTIALFGYGFMAIAVIEIFRYLIYGNSILPLVDIYIYLVIGLFLMLISILVGRYIKEHVITEAEIHGSWLR